MGIPTQHLQPSTLDSSLGFSTSHTTSAGPAFRSSRLHPPIAPPSSDAPSSAPTPSPSLPPPWARGLATQASLRTYLSRGAPFPGLPDPVWSEDAGSRVHRDTPVVQCRLTELTHHTRDLAYLHDYHGRVAHSLTDAQRAWLHHQVPTMGSGVYSCWDGIWRTVGEIESCIVRVRRELMSTNLWVNEEALDTFLLITGQ